MKRQSILVGIVVMTAGTSAYSTDWQLDWAGGDYIPTSWSWDIYPSPSHFPPSSHPPGTVPFSGPTGVFSNDCYAETGLGGTPTITIDPNRKTIELWFQPPPPTICYFYYDPVCGLNGWFGPLSEGNWLFYSNQIPYPYGSFYINFHVDAPIPPLTILNPNGDERLLGGSTYTIRWEDSRSGSCGGNYLLDYSINDGSSWIPVNHNPISNTCSYDWLTPSVDSNQCLIRITDASDPNISDTSDSSFRIYRCLYYVLGDWNGDCYVDFVDFSIIAAAWNVHGGTDMYDLAALVQYWLDCADPFDPSCNFGEAMPDFPAAGTVIDGVVMFADLFEGFIWTNLIFFPGPTAVEHTGYFSEDYSKVESRHQDANLGSPPYASIPGWEYTFFAGHPLVPPADYTLVRDTRYYWTVDAEDALGNTFAGDIWEFTILEFYASEPNPPNEATLVETDVLLSWQPGYDLTDYGPFQHEVYMGTDRTAVENAYITHNPPEFLGIATEPNIPVTSLELNTTYYWRVDEFHGWRIPPSVFELYKGPVWQFTTTPSALNNDGSIN
jgi:hypothetical protein